MRAPGITLTPHLQRQDLGSHRIDPMTITHAQTPAKKSFFTRTQQRTGFGPLVNTQANNGNATGNPTTSQIRQVLSGGGMAQEFLKNSYANKPKITQTLTTPEITTQFVLDVSAIPYIGAAATSTPAIITNTLDFVDPTIPGKFDMATDKQNSTVSAGNFTWTPGTNTGNSGGVYSYSEGGADVDTIDWMQLYNPADNTCWSYNGPSGCTP